MYETRSRLIFVPPFLLDEFLDALKQAAQPNSRIAYMRSHNRENVYITLLTSDEEIYLRLSLPVNIKFLNV